MFLKNKKSGTASAAKNFSPSIIASDMNFLGNIHCDGIIDCQGTIDGNIRCHMITVREGGFIKGEITADTALIYGKVNGLIRAKTVQLFSTCHIEGIVMHESLSIEDGAFVDGKCKRIDKQQEIAKPVTSMPFITDEEEESSSGEKPKFLENIRLISG